MTITKKSIGDRVDRLNEWVIEWIMRWSWVALAALAALAIVVGIGVAVRYIIASQSSGTPAAYVVTSKVHCPASETHSVLLVGKVIVPRTIHHPESWVLNGMASDGRRAEIEVSEETFQRAEVGRSYFWR